MHDDLPIIDAHHHFWDPKKNYHPWLRDEPMIPFRYGDYSSIRKRFMPEEYFAISKDHNVVATVTMEGEWNPRDPVGESLWMQAVSKQYGFPHAHVAQVWLDADNAETVLEQQAEIDIVKSVRHKPVAAATPDAKQTSAPGSMTCSKWRSGYALLNELGLHFDLQTPWWHLDDALQLADKYPDTRIILNHTGLPSDRSEQGLRGWREAMRNFASFPNAWVKISGLGLPGQPWRLVDNLPIIQSTIETFGEDRCIFASNFPVDGLCATFDTIFSGFKQAVADLSPDSQKKLFSTNAAACYGINP